MTSVTLIGATGLIGQHTLIQLENDKSIEKINVIARSNIGSTSPKTHCIEANFDALDEHHEAFQTDILISCLGTTIDKAKSKENFRKVDYDYVVNAAKLAKTHGVKKTIVISALGAKEKSPFFYNQVKGQMESALTSLDFESLSIIRPSLLMGQRTETRLKEDLSKPFMLAAKPLLLGGLKKYRAIQGQDVAAVIAQECKSLQTGHKIIYPSE